VLQRVKKDEMGKIYNTHYGDEIAYNSLSKPEVKRPLRDQSVSVG
jgi:hypothetical protein